MTAMAPEDQAFQRRIEATIQKVTAWETADVALLQQCRDSIPLQELVGLDSKYGRPEDICLNLGTRFLQRFARYFKEDVMTWVNQPPCTNSDCTCHGQTQDMKYQETRGPQTDEERQGQASRVEVYQCQNCQTITTFPRYNFVGTLMQTKTGRCGEYANLFGFYCRAIGLEVRYILDWTDHVWTEVFVNDNSSGSSRWMMVDSCEGVIDECSMYEAGWGKKLNMVVAISHTHIVDVTPKYTRHWNSDDFQARRRAITTSEQVSASIIQQLNAKLQQHCQVKDRDKIRLRLQRENKAILQWQQQTSWDHQYGRGRISGSLAWKVSRREDGRDNSKSTEDPQIIPSHFHVETFYPPPREQPTSSQWGDSHDGYTRIALDPKPKSRHEAIVVNNVACAIGGIDAISIVVLDETNGCILQSRCFVSWKDVAEFVATIPLYRIVAMVGALGTSSKEDKNNFGLDSTTISNLGKELGGLDIKLCQRNDGILYVGQVLSTPPWSFCGTYKDAPNGIFLHGTLNFRMNKHEVLSERKLQTARGIRPASITGRLPEIIMPMATQQIAGYEQKRAAFLSFVKEQRNCYYDCVAGYSTKHGAPVYLLGASAYPMTRSSDFQENDSDSWNTFLLLPPQLVPEEDVGIQDVAQKSKNKVPSFEVPLERSFFVQNLGTHLLKGQQKIPTEDALRNTRLVGLYFSAHWCGPCRSFTPMLAEMYEVLKDAFPAHGLDIVFVSSDRDAHSFNQYYATMPWLAIPFESLAFPKELLSATYGVRGIPSLVILDSMSGQVVVPNTETRQHVMQACNRGEDAIQAMFQATWLDRVPSESKAMLQILEMSTSAEGVNEDKESQESSSLVPESYLVRPGSREKQARLRAMIDELMADGIMSLDEAKMAAQAVEEANNEEGNKNELETGTFDVAFTCFIVPEDEHIPKRSSLDLAFNVMRAGGKDQLLSAVSLALKYLGNCQKSPWTPKFRKFSLSNKVADRITRVQGAIPLLESIGFAVAGDTEDFVASIPVFADLDKMKSDLEALLAKFDD